MAEFVDITGQRFGRLTALRLAERDHNLRTRWRVRCDCGTEKDVDGAHMRYGRIKSCGCWATEKRKADAPRLREICKLPRTHGMSNTPVYAVWKTMRDRCRNPNNKDYRHYGGRGIKVCAAWSRFERFYADMGAPPPGRTLDRIDPDGNYEPGNCRWATWREQNLNKRRE